MPKNKKQDSSSDSDSGPEDRGPAKKAKPAPEKSSKSNKGDDEELSWAIDKKRFVKLREFKGKWMVDIREYYDADGDLKPGKKGIALSIPQWRKLVDSINEIDESIKKNV